TRRADRTRRRSAAVRSSGGSRIECTATDHVQKDELAGGSRRVAESSDEVFQALEPNTDRTVGPLERSIDVVCDHDVVTGRVLPAKRLKVRDTYAGVARERILDAVTRQGARRWSASLSGERTSPFRTSRR